MMERLLIQGDRLTIIIERLWEQAENPLTVIVERIPDIGGRLAIAFLTILIPLAIAVLGDYFAKKKEDSDIPFAKLDLYVILDKIVRIKYLLLWSGSPFVVQVLWPVLPVAITFLASIWVVVALFKIGEVIVNLYKWIKGNQDEYRISYLKSFIPDRDLIVVWQSVWSSKQLNNFFLERQYFEIFTKIVNERINKIPQQTEDGHHVTVMLLEAMQNNLRLRSPIFLSTDPFITQVLQWHYIVSEKSRKMSEERTKPLIWSHCDHHQRILNNTIEAIIELASESPRSYRIHSIFDKISNHVIQHEENSDYLYDSISSVINATFRCLEKLQKTGKFGIAEVVRALPARWHITVERIQNRDKYAIFVWGITYNWLSERIRYHSRVNGIDKKNEKSYDGLAESVLSHLLPEIDPITFGKLLFFVMLNPQRMKIIDIVLFPRTFGLIGRSVVGEGSMSDVMRRYQKERLKQEKDSFTLIRLLFPEYFTDINLKKYLKELENAIHANEHEKGEIRDWQTIFHAILNSRLE